MTAKTKDLRCSFCRKPRDQVLKLIAGPEANICDECVDLSYRIITEELAAEGIPYPPEESE